MAAAFAFLGMLLLSLVVALLAALQLGDFFQAGDELLMVIAAITVFAMISIAIHAAVYAQAKRPSVLNALALALAILAAAASLWPGAAGRIAALSSNRVAEGAGPSAVALELLIPALFAVLVQWGLVRRRWLRAAGEDDFSCWPWLTTAVVGLGILNPIGLSFAWPALQASARDFTTLVTAGGAFALVVMGAIECYIKSRILRRRLGVPPP